MENLIRLEPTNKTYDIKDGIQAKLKDPLWMIGRQWQMGEFSASNGGQPVRMEAHYNRTPVPKLVKNGQATQIDPLIPLEKHVEEEVTGSAWDAKRLEYSFHIQSPEIDLVAEEYDGKNLDWYHFDLNANRIPATITTITKVVPNPIKYHGMPSARWWAHEDGQVNLGDLTRPHYNLLTMLLIEFGLIASQDWYQIPIEHTVGEVRNLVLLNVIDSFGISSTALPAYTSNFGLFTINGQNSPTDPRLFYFPNTLAHSLESKPLEEISFFRDELANLVWAIEQVYENQRGEIINRYEEEKEPLPLFPTYYWDNETEQLIERPQPFDPERFEGPLSRYVEKQVPPRNWIPYLQQFLNQEVILRRGRTYLNEKQYLGKILKESTQLAEEEISRSGIKVIRLKQLARKSGSNEIFLWEGRKKTTDRPQSFSNLAFDQLILP